jgi:sec-independent protein translocase protein TatB
MFDVSFGEMILLAAIALIAIGPKQLPQVARTLGRLLREFQKATGDFTRTIIEARDSAHQSLTDTQRAMNDSLTVDIDAKTKGPKLPEAPSAVSPVDQATAPASAQGAAQPAAKPATETPFTPVIQPAAEARPIGFVAPTAEPMIASGTAAAQPLPTDKKEV